MTSCTVGSQGGGNSLIGTRKKGGKGFTSLAHSQFCHCTPLLTFQTSAAHHSPRVPFQPLLDSFDCKGGDYGEPNNGDSDHSANGDMGHHSNFSDMATHAEDSGIDDWSVPDSHTMDVYSVDLLNSD